MLPIGSDTTCHSHRREARLFILLAALLLLAAFARVASAGECRAYDPMSGEDVLPQSYPSIERSIREQQ